MSERLIIGAMSGTSADGVDAALCRINHVNNRYHCSYIGHLESTFPSGLKDQILSIRSSSEVSLENLARLSRDISVAYADSIQALLERLNVSNNEISAIAAHGQTMFHGPPLTMQIFDPALVAQQTGIDVISDFRRADCAVGGQGAPLVPFADYHLFRSSECTRVILNIGGIANITVLKKGCTIDEVIGFDTGPGNCISDWLMRDRGGVDLGGKLASVGVPSTELLSQLMKQPYFSKAHPKSTDGPAMIDLWQQCIDSNTSISRIENLLATASHWVASTIMSSIDNTVDDDFELIVAGGGTKNQTIMRNIKQILDQMKMPLHQSDDLGIPSQAREAIAFAILGSATLDRIPANIPSVTGAQKKVILGSITPAK